MIGVFDSGYGGLTVLSGLFNKLPGYDYIYLGDNARAPYGNKSQEVIYSYTKEALDFLFNNGCEIVILACNTASSKALRRIQQEFLPEHYPGKKVLGVVIPLAEAINPVKGAKRVGVIGTKATIGSSVYSTEIKKIYPDIEVFEKACPLLVPLIEEGWCKKVETRMILKKYLRPLKTKGIDTLILGCTHYPFLIEIIKSIMGKRVWIPDPPAIIAKSFKHYLERHPEIENKLSKDSRRSYYTTDDKGSFRDFADKFFPFRIDLIERVDLK